MDQCKSVQVAAGEKSHKCRAGTSRETEEKHKEGENQLLLNTFFDCLISWNINGFFFFLQNSLVIFALTDEYICFNN